MGIKAFLLETTTIFMLNGSLDALTNETYSQDKQINYHASIVMGRQGIQDYVKDTYGVHVFGKDLDNIMNQVSNGAFFLDIPERYYRKMDFNIDIDRKSRKLMLYESGELLLETKVAVGLNKHKSKTTPKGDFFINRVVYRPFYYPPKWSEFKRRQPPGNNNPFGLWMAEIVTEDTSGSYDHNISYDSSFRIHSTNVPWTIGSTSTHGCVRIHPKIAEELFSGLLECASHKDGKNNSRGFIYPLDDAIPLSIK